MSDYTLGADPEFFLSDAEGLPRSAVGVIGGSKAQPLPMSGLSEGFAVQEDNVMVEFNIPPVRSVGRWDEVFDEALGWFDENVGGPFLFQCEAEFSAQVLSHPQAATFGCSPDFDAYRHGAPAPKIDPRTIGRRRFAGGHIHLGYDFKIPPFVMASFCDATMGLMSITHGDVQGERRKLYGAAGRFRPTNYGMEYRVLSNYWVTHSRKRRQLADTAFDLMNSIGRVSLDTVKRWYAETPWHDVQRAINTEDEHLAQSLYRYIQSEVLDS